MMMKSHMGTAILAVVLSSIINNVVLLVEAQRYPPYVYGAYRGYGPPNQQVQHPNNNNNNKKNLKAPNNNNAPNKYHNNKKQKRNIAHRLGNGSRHKNHNHNNNNNNGSSGGTPPSTPGGGLAPPATTTTIYNGGSGNEAPEATSPEATSLPPPPPPPVIIPEPPKPIRHFYSLVNAAQEKPSCFKENTNEFLSNAIGNAFLTYEEKVDDNDDDEKTLCMYFTYQGLSGPELVSHIHGPANFNETGPVAFTLSSSQTSKQDCIKLTTQEQVDALFAGLYYFNVHTEACPAGEIRGQILPF